MKKELWLRVETVDEALDARRKGLTLRVKDYDDAEVRRMSDEDIIRLVGLGAVRRLKPRPDTTA